MSRIGKQPIEILVGVEVDIQGTLVKVRGPKGELSREFRNEMSIVKEENQIMVRPNEESRMARALWGLTRTLLANMVYGVSVGYEKKLEIDGIGYRAAVEEGILSLQVGFSHPVTMKTPDAMTVSVEKNVITVGGIDKEQVGQFAAKIRRVKPPEPYKLKGIHYEGEVLRKKVGKKAVGAGG